MARDDEDPHAGAQAEPADGEGQRHTGVQKRVLTASQVLATLLLELLLELEGSGSSASRAAVKSLHDDYSFSLKRIITRGRP